VPVQCRHPLAIDGNVLLNHSGNFDFRCWRRGGGFWSPTAKTKCGGGSGKGERNQEFSCREKRLSALRMQRVKFHKLPPKTLKQRLRFEFVLCSPLKILKRLRRASSSCTIQVR